MGQLAITSPADQAEYVLTGEPAGDRIRLRASLDHASSLHWYLDGTYLTTAEPGAPPLLELEEGEHRVACVTSEGASDVARFDVHPPERFATR